MYSVYVMGQAKLIRGVSFSIENFMMPIPNPSFRSIMDTMNKSWEGTS